MRVITGLVGALLLLFGALHAFIPHLPASTIMWLYFAGAILAFLSWADQMPLLLARLLAVAATAAMFVYFAAFFTMAPDFHEEWYRSGVALQGLGMLISAFAMIPVLSCYSCMLKADCRETLTKAPNRPAFFSVPESVQEKV